MVDAGSTNCCQQRYNLVDWQHWCKETSSRCSRSRQSRRSGRRTISGASSHVYVRVSSYEMSIPYSGIRSRSCGVISAIIKHLKSVNLQPVKRIDVRFDPFYKNAKETRDFMHYISAPKIGATNPYCLFKTQVVCDYSEPIVTFSLQSGDKVVLKAGLLSCLNILELYNKHITPLAPPDPAKLEAEQELLEKKKKRKRQKHKIKEGSKHRGVYL